MDKFNCIEYALEIGNNVKIKEDNIGELQLFDNKTYTIIGDQVAFVRGRDILYVFLVKINGE